MRNQSIDLVKMIAAFGVVVIHLAPSTESAEVVTRFFGIFAVPFFLVVSLYFFIVRVAKLVSPRFQELRLDRILVPYFAWSVVYTLMRWLKFLSSGEDFEINFVSLIFFGGGAVQLYFLPLLLLFQALALAFLLVFRGPRKKLIALCILVLAILYGSVGSAGGFFGFQDALIRGFLYVIAAFGFYWIQICPQSRSISKFLGSLICPVVIIISFIGLLPSWLGIVLGPLAGFGVAALAFGLPALPESLLSRSILSCSYAVYLAHFGFLETYEFVASRLGILVIPYSLTHKLLLGALFTLCSIVFALMARRHWLTSYLFLGEWLPSRVDINELVQEKA